MGRRPWWRLVQNRADSPKLRRTGVPGEGIAKETEDSRYHHGVRPAPSGDDASGDDNERTARRVTHDYGRRCRMRISTDGGRSDTRTATAQYEPHPWSGHEAGDVASPGSTRAAAALPTSSQRFARLSRSGVSAIPRGRFRARVFLAWAFLPYVQDAGDTRCILAGQDRREQETGSEGAGEARPGPVARVHRMGVRTPGPGAAGDRDSNRWDCPLARSGSVSGELQRSSPGREERARLFR